VCICERYIVGGWVVDDKTCRLPELYEWKWVPMHI